MNAQGQDLKDAVAADRRGVSQPRRQASRTRRSTPRTHRQALPLRTRTSRRSHPQEAQAAPQGSDGRHPAPPAPELTLAFAARGSTRPSRSRGRAGFAPASGSLDRLMRIDLAGLPFIGGALALALVAGAAVAWLLALPFVVARRVLRVLFPRSRTRVASRRRRRCVLSPADGRVLVGRRCAIADAAPPGDVEAGQHLPVADGRARQPRARRPGP